MRPESERRPLPCPRREQPRFRSLLLLGLSLGPAAVSATACRSEGTTASALVSGSASASASTVPVPVVIDQAASDACAARRNEAMAQPGLPGSPALTAHAVDFARVRSRAALWRREPTMPPALEALGQQERSSLRLVRAVRELMNKSDETRADRRRAILSEGYLFARDPRLGLALIEQVALPRLFDEKTLYLRRGVDIFELAYRPESKLDKERFLYQGGPFDGEKAELLFGDRVAVSREELDASPPLAVDLRDLMNRSGFDRIRPVHLTETALVADVRYGAGAWVPAFLELKGARAEIACEVLTSGLAAARASFLAQHRVRRAAVEKIRATVRQMVRERLPFDAAPEKKNGFLRKAWRRAYFAGWRTFQFEGDSFDVYTDSGAPRPPQVCVDFLTDVWDRASGTWFRSAEPGDPPTPSPRKLQGGIDIDALGLVNRRSVAELTEFAESHATLFDVWEVPRAERISFKEREAFFAYLHDHADQFLPGDMLTVHGFKEGGRPHYHSLILLEQDPVTGVPSLVAGNASFPREQSLEGALEMSPKRSIKHRIRAREKWLTAVAAAASTPVAAAASAPVAASTSTPATASASASTAVSASAP